MEHNECTRKQDIYTIVVGCLVYMTDDKVRVRTLSTPTPPTLFQVLELMINLDCSNHYSASFRLSTQYGNMKMLVKNTPALALSVGGAGSNGGRSTIALRKKSGTYCISWVSSAGLAYRVRPKNNPGRRLSCMIHEEFKRFQRGIYEMVVSVRSLHAGPRSISHTFYQHPWSMVGPRHASVAAERRVFLVVVAVVVRTSKVPPIAPHHVHIYHQPRYFTSPFFFLYLRKKKKNETAFKIPSTTT